jgi:hypothetical protein
VSGGVAPANLHLWLSYDRALNANILVGARLGYTLLNSYPGTAGGTPLNVHAEARFTYVLGANALVNSPDAPKFAPYFFVGAGITTITTSIQVPVVDANGSKYVNAWAIGGPGYVGFGAGLRIAAGSPKAAIMIAPAKLSLALGGASTVVALSPELAFQYGF